MTNDDLLDVWLPVLYLAVALLPLVLIIVSRRLFIMRRQREAVTTDEIAAFDAAWKEGAE